MAREVTYHELANAVMREPTHEARSHVFREVMADESVADTTMRRLEFRARFVTAVREQYESRKVRAPWAP